MTERRPVLVVDDDDDLREILVMVLRAHGYPTLEASDGFEALDRLHAGPRPSLILLDLRMPRMNGTEFLEALHAEAPAHAIPVVVITGDVAGTSDALAAGADACLRKPVDARQLLASVAQYAI